MRRVVEVVADGGIAKEWLEALEGGEYGVTHDRGDEAGQDRLHLEVVAVDDLRREDRPSEWSSEDRPDPGPDPHRHGDAPVGGAQVQRSGEEGAEPRADLRCRPLTTARATRADGDGRGHDLHQHRPEADPPGVVMDRGDRRVGAVTLGLGREPKDQGS